MRVAIIVGFFSMMIWTSTLIASEFGYTYLDLGYHQTEIDAVYETVDADGFYLSGSVNLTDHFAITGEYAEDNIDYGIDVTVISAGIDFHNGLSESTDLVLGFSVVDAEISYAYWFPTESDTGWVTNLSVRHQLSDQVEFSGGVSHSNIFEDTATGYGVELLIDLSPSTALGLGYGWGDDIKTFGLVLRFI